MTRSLFLRNYESLIFVVIVSILLKTCATNLTKERCQRAVQEALSMGLSFPQPEKLPMFLNPTTQSEQRQHQTTENPQLSRDNGRTSNTITSTTVDENSRNAKESLYLWLSETQLNQLLEYNFLDTYRAHAGQGRSLSDLNWDANQSQLYHQSLCYWSDTNLPKHTCCTFQMELGLLQKTTDELHQSLSNYLGRWHKELSKLRTALRDQLIESLELLKIKLNQTFCSNELIIIKTNNNTPLNDSNITWNCWYHIIELISKFRLILEQSFLIQDDIILDLMLPVDNYLIQSLLETSCQSNIIDSKNIQAEELDEKIKCHEYCQARLNLIFDSLTGHSDLPSLTRKSRNLFVNNKVNRHSLLPLPNDRNHPMKDEERRISKGRTVKSSNNINNNINTHNNDNDINQINNVLIEAEQYRMLYRPELVFTFRLNRKLIQSLELGESLIDGLKNFNIAQGTCMRKLMRMHYCALCSGETLSRPCPGLCLKILSDCLRPLSQLNPQWYRFTETIKSVADIFLEKPQLRLESQLDDFPEHLVNYYHQLLHTYHNWLQPQCSGIKKLYNVFDQLKNNSKTIFQTMKKNNNTKRLKHHKKIFEQMKTTMDEIKNIWSHSSTALCLESPYLALINRRRDQCWNGTTIASFNEEKCTFCQHEPKLQETIITNSHNENSNEKLPPSRKQRTSFIPTNDIQQQSSISETDDLLSASIASTNYLLNNPSWNSPLQHDKELAFRRANEILVRASRDLEWSVKSLLSETNYYNSLNAKSTSNGGDKSKGNTPPESWARISTSQKPGEQYETGKTSSNPHSDMTNSLGMLAYGSILNWNAQGEGGEEEEKEEEVQRKIPMNSRNNNPSSLDSSSKPIRMTINQKNSKKKNSPDKTQRTRPLERNSNLASGFIPGWTLYAWTPISSPAKEHTYDKPVDNSFVQEDTNYGESGLHDTKGELDYPQLFPFVNMNSQGLNISIMGSDEKFLRNNSVFNPNYYHNLNNSLWTNKQNTKNNKTTNLTDLNKIQDPNSNKNGAMCIELQHEQYYIINISISVMLLIYLLGI
uniref:Glypican n=1 Tax=Schistosoma mansoni TaxID=6183 RepID=A0AA82MYK3_SCHMA